MDRRSWPWKKKSSDKQAAERAEDSSAAASDLGATQINKDKQEAGKKLKYVQISIESYTHLTGLEDRVKSLEGELKSLDDEVKELNEKLSDAHIEINEKENLVKQHAKVAEEAVSGWEKAEAEAATLKTHLESVTLLKLTAEDRATYLDGALKECMWKIRNLKEEHEKKMNEVVLSKTKLFDKIKLEVEAKIANLDQELLTSAAENAALSRSLQERANLIIKLSEEKSEADAEIEFLKSNIESREKEVHSLKYELHIARKEVEIRSEEKNMSLRSAEVANKQHLERVKKIAKLEAECQRLRGLVRKKLPGPAAVAQMKLEVENLGRDHGESLIRRSPVKPHSPYFSQLTEFSFDNTQMYQKENVLLTERLLAMEEETKMLKEALANRNSELQASRSLCAQTNSKLQCLEAQLLPNDEQRSTPRSRVQATVESFFDKKSSNPPSFISVSEERNDDVVSCASSWTPLMSTEQCHLKNGKDSGGPCKSDNTNHMDLMDDFLEMEKIACLSTESKGIDSSSNVLGCAINVTRPHSGKQHVQAQLSPKDIAALANSQHLADPLIFVKLQSQIWTILESMSKENDKEKVVEDIKCVMQVMHETLRHKSVSGLSAGEGNSCINTTQTTNQQLDIALSQIYDFVIALGNEAKIVSETSPDGGLNQKLDRFSAKYSEAISSDVNLIDFVFDVSHVLNGASELRFNILGFKNNEVETGSFDCIDKIALPENKAAAADSSGERYANGGANFSDSASDPDVPHEGNFVPTSESTAKTWKCSFEEFQQLKFDNDNLSVDLAECRENLESTKSQLLETERQLSEVKSHLSLAEKSNSLAETQLKCMAESYKSLEIRAEELEAEVNVLQGKIESLDTELQEERKSHQDALAKYEDLQEQLQRINNFPTADNGDKTSQEKDLAAAAEKLEECQETIFLLGKQLKAFRSQTDIVSSPKTERSQKFEVSNEEEPSISGATLPVPEMDTIYSLTMHDAGNDSPLHHQVTTQFSPSDSEATNPSRSPINSIHSKHRPSKSGSSSASSTPTPEKQSRGFSRFFSSKEKNSR